MQNANAKCKCKMQMQNAKSKCKMQIPFSIPRQIVRAVRPGLKIISQITIRSLKK